MADTIQLTPAELTAQAQQMMSVCEEFNDIFKNVEGVLGNINDSWSAKLAHNFLSKITSAQNGFSKIIELITGGANAATTAAEAFTNVDEELAKLFSGDGILSSFGGVNGIIDTVHTLMPNSELLSVLSEMDVQKFYEAIKNGDFGGVAEVLYPGFTDGLQGKLGEIIKDATGVNIDTTKILQDVKDGNYLEALFDTAGATLDGFNQATGGTNQYGIALDFVRNLGKQAFDSNSTANQNADIYANRILDALDEHDVKKVIGSVIDYTIDVPTTMILDAAGTTVSHVVDNFSKSKIGVSVSEINDKIEDVVGVNPGKVVGNVLDNLLENHHETVVNAGIGDYVVEGVSNAVKAGGEFIKEAAKGLGPIGKLFS